MTNCTLGKKAKNDHLISCFFKDGMSKMSVTY